MKTVCMFLLFVGLVSTASPQSFKVKKTKKTEPSALESIWRLGIQGDPSYHNIIKSHQTKSDAMQLYSIQAKQIVKIGEVESSASWEPKYELSVTSKKSRSRRDNKFVTETVSYQRLKIRSADNNKYICAKTNGEIVFKDFADKEELDGSRAFFMEKSDKNNKPRKRCLFHWEFTDQMHIKLSLEAANKTRYYLSVKNDVVSLRKMDQSTELERSFIWLPTKPAIKRFRVGPIGRSFFSNSKKYFQQETIKSLKKQLTQLKDKLSELKLLEEKMSDALYD